MGYNDFSNNNIKQKMVVIPSPSIATVSLKIVKEILTVYKFLKAGVKDIIYIDIAIIFKQFYKLSKFIWEKNENSLCYIKPFIFNG